MDISSRFKYVSIAGEFIKMRLSDNDICAAAALSAIWIAIEMTLLQCRFSSSANK